MLMLRPRFSRRPRTTCTGAIFQRKSLQSSLLRAGRLWPWRWCRWALLSFWAEMNWARYPYLQSTWKHALFVLLPNWIRCPCPACITHWHWVVWCMVELAFVELTSTESSGTSSIRRNACVALLRFVTCCRLCSPIQHHAGDQPDLMINGDNNLEEIFKWAPTGPGNTHAVFLNNKQCSYFLFEILIWCLSAIPYVP